MRRALLDWYDANRRDLPWRRTRDPYAIWISEAMLQQTQVQTVIPYWERWLARFPTVESLAQATEDDVLALWQGLGYYRRGRSLREAAQVIVREGMPTTADGWAKLPGVGPYTAGAVASIAFGAVAPVVDGNVQRVYARWTDDASSGPALAKATWIWARAQLDADRPGDWNQALMELGATVCTPKRPSCASCPIRYSCAAHREGTVDERPVKAGRKANIEMTRRIVVPRLGDRVGLVKVPTGEWWEGMWAFPSGGWESEYVGEFTFVVTRHRVRAIVEVANLDEPSDDLVWVAVGDLTAFALPAPMRRALEIADSRPPSLF